MRRALPISVPHGHFHGFVTLRGNIRCSIDLTRHQLVRDLGEGLESVHVLQDLVPGGGRRLSKRERAVPLFKLVQDFDQRASPSCC